MKNLKDKVVIVTGSSRGIGKGIAKLFLEKEAYVMLNGRNIERLEETKAELCKISSRVDYCCCDVSDSKNSEQLINETVDRFGRIDVLINNVGVSNRGNVVDCSPEVFERVMGSNFHGTVNPTIYALPHIKKNKGSLVFISSVAGIRGLPGLGAYCASKMALRALAESIRIEEAKSQIHVGLIYVGVTEIEHKKEAISSNGEPVILQDRTDKKVHSTEQVARKVLMNILGNKFITTLSTIGKLNRFMQALFPSLVERLIIMNSKKFKEGSK